MVDNQCDFVRISFSSFFAINRHLSPNVAFIRRLLQGKWHPCSRKCAISSILSAYGSSSSQLLSWTARSEFVQKTDDLTAMVANAAPILVMGNDTTTLSNMLASVARDPDFMHGLVANDFFPLTSIGADGEPSSAFNPQVIEAAVGDMPFDFVADNPVHTIDRGDSLMHVRALHIGSDQRLVGYVAMEFSRARLATGIAAETRAIVA